MPNTTFKYHLIFLIPVLIFMSCKTKTPSGLKIKKMRTPALLTKIDSQISRPTWFGTKYKGRITLDNKRVGVSGNMRLKKDSLIWFNTKVFGIEMARGQASQDSIWFVNRYQNTYYKGALPKRYMNFSAGQLFNLLTDIITNQMTPIEPFEYESKIVENDYQMLYNEEEKSLMYLIHPIDYMVNRVHIEDKMEAFEFDYALDDFEANSTLLMAQKRIINVDLKRSHFALDLQLSNITINEPQKMPFSIPQKYTQVFDLNLGM